MNAQRTLPPSAAPIEWRDLWYGLWGAVRPRQAVHRIEEEFRAHFGVKHVYFVSSGKAALVLILKALQRLNGRTRVIVPGYTCFSVPSAVMRAGLSVAVCDVDPDTFDLDYEQLAERADASVLCVLATHLLGLGVDVPRIIQHCRARGIYVVEDVAQAFGGTREGRPFGSLGDVSFLSFGRGKNVTCGSGGAILTNDDRIGAAIAQAYAELPEESRLNMLKNWLEVAVTQLLIHPSRYWLPAGLPFLKLGETKFYTDFPIVRLDSIRAGLLRRWKQRLAHSTTARVQHAQAMQRALTSIVAPRAIPCGQGESVYLRVPVVLGSPQEKQALLQRSMEEGLGLSGMYPSSISEIAPLRQALSDQPTPQASSLAARLVTLPTHAFVTEADVVRIGRAIQGVLQKKRGGMTSPTVAPQPQHVITADELPRVG